MSISSFQENRISLGREAGEELEMAYLDNHHTSSSHTLLLLHGLFDHKSTWNHLCPLLTRSYRLIAPDLIGFGYSSKPLLRHLSAPYRYSTPMHTDYLHRFVVRLGLDNLILAGNSLGGGIALHLLCTCPELSRRVRGLILINAAGYPQELPGHIRELGTWLGTLMNIRLCRWLAFHSGLVSRALRHSFERAFYNPQKIPPEQLAAAMDVLKTPNIFYSYRTAARNIALPNHRALVEKFTQIACPTLIIWGREDRIISALFALRFEKDIPRAELHIIDQCGHSPHLECPGQVAGFIEQWAEKHIHPHT